MTDMFEFWPQSLWTEPSYYFKIENKKFFSFKAQVSEKLQLSLLAPLEYGTKTHVLAGCWLFPCMQLDRRSPMV